MLGNPVDIPSAVSFIQHAFVHILDRFASLIIPYRQPRRAPRNVEPRKNYAMEIKNENHSFACPLRADI